MKSLPPILAALLALGLACSSKNSTSQAGGDGGTTDSCGTDLVDDDFCSTCTVSPNASPSSCKAPRVVNACCAFLQPPSQELARGTGLHRFTSDNPTLDLGCLANPPIAGTPKPVTLKGFVRLFSSGNDSKGVKIEIFKEGKDGALGELVGDAVVTTEGDAEMMPRPDWPSKCPDGGCSFRAYSYPAVPTETPLIIKTSDATGGQQWAALYDYNVYIANTAVSATDEASYEVSAVAATDLNTVASAAGGFTIRQDRGLLAGEVHDCADVRVSGATVDTDVAHEGDMFYFGENEADPLPDKSRGSLGTSKIGLFGALNITAGVPIRLSAVGKVNGVTTLLGTYVVQTFPGSVTALSFRGRRPFQEIGSRGSVTTTRDSLFEGALVLEQPKHGYRFNVDAVLLAEFASARKARAAFDLGAGVGAVGLSLLHLGGASHVTLVERDPEAARLARANIVTNARERAAVVVEGDVGDVEHVSGQADLIICNPPYVPPGRGRSPAEQRRAAKQGSLGVFLDAARRLAGRRARACFIYPAIELVTLVSELRRRGLEPKRLQLVHGKADRKAHVVLVECALGKPGGLVVLPPRFLV